MAPPTHLGHIKLCRKMRQLLAEHGTVGFPASYGMGLHGPWGGGLGGQLGPTHTLPCTPCVGPEGLLAWMTPASLASTVKTGPWAPMGGQDRQISVLSLQSERASDWPPAETGIPCLEVVWP